MSRETMRLPEIDLRFTYQDYCLLPDDGKRHEIIDGELLTTPSPTTKHQALSMNLSVALFEYTRANQLGRVFSAPCDVVLSDMDVVQPDILFISKKRDSIITERNIQGAPDLVVEITSPTTEKTDRTLKKNLYAKYSVREYWIVYAERELVEIWTLDGSGYKSHGVFRNHEALRSPLLEGLSLRLDSIFE